MTAKMNTKQPIVSMDVWSALVEEVQLPAVAADVTIADIVVDKLPAGARVQSAKLIYAFGARENTNAGANKLSGAQHIQIAKGAGSYADAISLADDLFGLAASTREGGDAIISDHDLLATVTGNDTYHVKWTDALADLANINFNDVQVGLRIWYSI